MRINLIVLLVLICNTSCSAQSVDEEKNNLFSVVDLPVDVHPIETIEDWYPNGDGYYFARYDIENEALQLQIKEKLMENDNVKKLPFGNEIIDDLIFEYVEDKDEGLYLLNFNRNDPRDIHLIVWDETKEKLFFLISYQ